jgi:methylated-DNA-[protein]-cysteine S-methyltransferase
MRVHHAQVKTKLGEVTLLSDGAALTGLYFPHHWYMPDVDTFGKAIDPQQDAILNQAANELQEYLSGERRTLDVPLVALGDDFSDRVWKLLREIPYGQTTTYGALAERLGDKSLAQRVGDAVGHNPLCVFIPCHRVVGASGALTGYAGGLARKKALLELEESADKRDERLF